MPGIIDDVDPHVEIMGRCFGSHNGDLFQNGTVDAIISEIPAGSSFREEFLHLGGSGIKTSVKRYWCITLPGHRFFLAYGDALAAGAAVLVINLNITGDNIDAVLVAYV
jgi:hypothetical protein